MIDDAVNMGSLPALERLVQFAGARHRMITNNVANLDTPGFRPLDVSVQAFQAQLAEAVDTGREPVDSPQVEFTRGGVVLHPDPAGANILFHDDNDRSLERTMQDLAENFMTFRVASELLRSRLDLINTAIREHI